MATPDVAVTDAAAVAAAAASEIAACVNYILILQLGRADVLLAL